MDDLTALALNGFQYERWLPIVGFEAFYEVSDLGRVRSFARDVSRVRRGRVEKFTRAPRFLKPHAEKPRKGQTWYARVGLCLPGEPAALYLVNRLVLQAFVGPCPVDMESCHWDGDGLNNRLTNLRWDTHPSNHLDTVRQGRFYLPHVGAGEDHPNAKLTNGQRAEILARRGETHKALADEFGVSFQRIAQIRKAA